MTEEMKSLEELQTVGSDADVQIEVAAPREPMRDALGRAYATGKRKDAVARVWIKPGSGKVVVNGKEMNAYFARPVLQMILRPSQSRRLTISKQPWRLPMRWLCTHSSGK